MKKTTILFILFTIIHCYALAQIQELAKAKNYDETLNANLLVVLKYSDSMNLRLKEAFQKYWTVTPYSFVDKSYKDSIRPLKGQRAYAVFEGTIVRVVQVNMETQIEKGTPTSWPGFYVAPLNQKKEPQVDLICARSAVNSFYYEWSKEGGFENCYYRIDFIVKQANDILSYIKANRSGDRSDFRKYVNQKAVALREKTLLVPEELTKPYDINKANLDLMEYGLGGRPVASKKPIMQQMLQADDLADYKGRVKILPYAEIARLSTSPQAKEYALFSPVVNDMKIVFIYDLATKELIYTDETFMGLKVKGKDFKELNKAAGL